MERTLMWYKQALPQLSFGFLRTLASWHDIPHNGTKIVLIDKILGHIFPNHKHNGHVRSSSSEGRIYSGIKDELQAIAEKQLGTELELQKKRMHAEAKVSCLQRNFVQTRGRPLWMCVRILTKFHDTIKILVPCRVKRVSRKGTCITLDIPPFSMEDIPLPHEIVYEKAQAIKKLYPAGRSEPPYPIGPTLQTEFDHIQKDMENLSGSTLADYDSCPQDKVSSHVRVQDGIVYFSDESVSIVRKWPCTFQVVKHDSYSTLVPLRDTIQMQNIRFMQTNVRSYYTTAGVVPIKVMDDVVMEMDDPNRTMLWKRGTERWTTRVPVIPQYVFPPSMVITQLSNAESYNAWKFQKRMVHGVTYHHPLEGCKIEFLVQEYMLANEIEDKVAILCPRLFPELQKKIASQSSTCPINLFSLDPSRIHYFFLPRRALARCESPF